MHNAAVFRRSEALGYAFMPIPAKLSFVSVAGIFPKCFYPIICLLGFVAYSNPPVEVVGSATVLSKKIALLTKRKMATILNIARDNGTYTLYSLSITLTDPRT